MSKCPIFLLREDKRFQLREFPSGGQQQAWIQFYSSWAIQSISRDGRWDKGKELCFVIKCRVKVVICKMLQNALTENFKQISCALFLSDFPPVHGQLQWIHTYMGNHTSWGFSLNLCWFCFLFSPFFFSSSNFFSFHSGYLHPFFFPQTNHLQVQFGMKTDCYLSSLSTHDRLWQNPWKTPDSTGVMITKLNMTIITKMNYVKGTFA